MFKISWKTSAEQDYVLVVMKVMSLIFQDVKSSRQRGCEGAAMCRIEKYGGRRSLPKLWYLSRGLLGCEHQKSEKLLRAYQNGNVK